MQQNTPTEIWATLAGQIDQNMTQRVFQFFANVSHDNVDHVHLLIQSGGGFVSDGVCLYNYLSSIPIDITAYNVGNVSSMAVIVFLAAQKRIATVNSTFMIHKTHSSPNPGSTSLALKEIADSLDIDNSRTEAILKSKLSLPAEKWTMHEHGNVTFTAEEAVKFAMVHEIGDFKVNGPLFNIYLTPGQ